MRECTNCHRELPEGEFYRYRSGSLFRHCKQCLKKKRDNDTWRDRNSEAQKRRYYKEKRDRARRIASGTTKQITCRICGETKNEKYFGILRTKCHQCHWKKQGSNP